MSSDNNTDTADMQDVDDFRQHILDEYERLNLDSKFKFNCGNEMKCFTKCCGDINIFLTPYDIIRLKNRLGMASQDFIEKYTLNPFTKTQRLPSALLKLDEDKRCPFVTDEGCSVYEDRPWACRMYPIGLASPSDESMESGAEEEFYFMMAEDHCLGVKECDRELTIREWIEDQGIAPYNEMGEYFKSVSMHKLLHEIELTPQKMEMYYMVCYNIDAFKKFVFESRFTDVYEIEQETLDIIKEDDVELFKFGVDYLLFGLYNEPTIKVKSEVLKAKRKAMRLDD